MLECIENTMVFTDSDSVCLGSNPSPAAILKPLETVAFQGVFALPSGAKKAPALPGKIALTRGFTRESKCLACMRREWEAVASCPLADGSARAMVSFDAPFRAV